MSPNYLENQIDEAFAGHGWPPGKDAPALLMDAARELRQLRGTFSLAEEGLANATQEIQTLQAPYRDAQYWKAQHLIAMQEIQRLQVALNFWLPMVPENAPLDENACLSRLERDAALLFGFKGENVDEHCAAELGWITLNAEPQTAEHELNTPKTVDCG